MAKAKELGAIGLECNAGNEDFSNGKGQGIYGLLN